MKSKPFFILALFILGAVILSGAIFFLQRVQTRSGAPQRAVQTRTVKTFPSGTFPQAAEPVSVSVEKAPETKTVLVSWDDMQWNVFYLVLFDAEELKTGSDKALVWLASSLEGGFLPDDATEKKDAAGFIQSGYTLGDALPGFYHDPPPSGGIELVEGKKYYLQLNGFTQKDELVTVNKKFTFTNSCLPPDCK